MFEASRTQAYRIRAGAVTEAPDARPVSQRLLVQIPDAISYDSIVTRRGNFLHNAPTESCLKTLKVERAAPCDTSRGIKPDLISLIALNGFTKNACTERSTIGYPRSAA
jgi:hypothetical protein